jgi:hypothetical protein
MVDRQRQQLKDTRPAGEGLGDRSRQAEVLGAGQDPAAGPRIVVDVGLQVGQQVGCVLHLVEDRAVRVIPEETSGI